MSNPFNIQEDNIHDRGLSETPRQQWHEGIAPHTAPEISYLKTSLKRRRLYAGFVIFLAVLFLLTGRSAQLQIIERDKYRAAADANRMRIERVRAARGEIVDRNDTPLTRNIPRFQIVLNPLDLPARGAQRSYALRTVAAAAALPFDELVAAASNLKPPVAPIILNSGLTLEEVYPFLLKTQHVPGVISEIISTREYIGGNSLSHILGYIGPIDLEEKSYYLEKNYRLGDLVGKVGLEATLEDILRGADGRRYIEVDAVGKVKAVLAQEEAHPGMRVKLTLNLKLQEAVAGFLRDALKKLERARASALVLNPESGEILAMVSIPDYDNNLFTIGDRRSAEFIELFTNPDNPLFPRAFAGTYPSGSTIKPAIAAAALQERVITPRRTYLSAGGLRVSQWFFPDWKAGGHGLTDVRKALAESVNTFFYIIGGGYNDLPGLGIEKLADYLGRFGFGKLTGIEIPGEVAGLVATPQWKEDIKKEQWYIGDTYHMAIGQGDLLVTPLQIARMTAYFASSGKWTQPWIVMETLNHEGIKSLNDAGPQIDPEYIRVVREGLRDAVRYGSARALQALPLTSAGKTGTAQWSSVKDTHAWFTGWAPDENPEISVTILIEEGGEGSQVAVPVARQIFEWWYTNRMENK